MFRSLGTEVPRIKSIPDTVFPVSIEEMRDQFLSENSIKNDGYIFYDDKSVQSLSVEEKEIIHKYILLRQMCSDPSNTPSEILYLIDHLYPVKEEKFITPLNFVNYEV